MSNDLSGPQGPRLDAPAPPAYANYPPPIMPPPAPAQPSQPSADEKTRRRAGVLLLVLAAWQFFNGLFAFASYDEWSSPAVGFIPFLMLPAALGMLTTGIVLLVTATKGGRRGPIAAFIFIGVACLLTLLGSRMAGLGMVPLFGTALLGWPVVQWLRRAHS